MSLNKHLIQIKDFPEYSVDEHGNIYNKNNEKLSQCVNRNGYLMVKLCRNGYEKNCSVHRLVADSFYDGYHEGLDVNHIDGNKQNNFIGNLEFCTRSENLKHAYLHNLKRSYLNDYDRKKGAKTSGEKSSRSVRVIETGVIYPSIREYARQIGGHANTILACCNGRYKQHHGYSFEWV